MQRPNTPEPCKTPLVWPCLRLTCRRIVKENSGPGILAPDASRVIIGSDKIGAPGEALGPR